MELGSSMNGGNGRLDAIGWFCDEFDRQLLRFRKLEEPNLRFLPIPSLLTVTDTKLVKTRQISK